MADNCTDSKPFDVSPSNSCQDTSAPVDPGTPKVIFSPKEKYYDMRGQKLLIIFNHYTYDNGSDYYNNIRLHNREGTQKDVQKLTTTFTELGFTVILHNDLTYLELLIEIDKLRNTDMSTVSCLCIAIMTHGMSGGKLCAKNRSYDISEVLTPLQNHPGLIGKPKLLLVQACRGGKEDLGHTVQTDYGRRDDGGTFTIPLHADFLIMRSSVEDYVSYRLMEGSLLIQKLCTALKENYVELDILRIVTLAQNAVAVQQIREDGHRTIIQMPETSFTLTKFLYFY